MSTRATLTVKDAHDQFHIYRHHDGYPDGQHGVVHDINFAQNLAWELPRYEAEEFAAAVVAVMKQGPGSVYLTDDPDAHLDREYHYQIEPLRDRVLTKVNLTILKRDWLSGRDSSNTMLQIFNAPLDKAAETYCSPEEGPELPRQVRILRQAEQTLIRAQEEITSLCGEHPDTDTRLVHDDIEKAVRQLAQFQRLLEKNDPWQALSRLDLPANAYDANAALKAQKQFQR